MKNKHTKLVVLLLAFAMIFVLSGCTKGFLIDGWDREAKGVHYGPGFSAGTVIDQQAAANANVIINSDGSAGVPNYSLKGPDANGYVYSVDGSINSAMTTTQAVFAH